MGRFAAAGGLLGASTLFTMGLLGSVVEAKPGPSNPGTPPASSNACEYPPGLARIHHQVSATSVQAGETVGNVGKVTRNSCPVNGVKIGVYAAPDADSTFTKVAETVTAEDGSWSAPVTVRKTTLLKSVVMDPATGTAESAPVKVTTR